MQKRHAQSLRCFIILIVSAACLLRTVERCESGKAQQDVKQLQRSKRMSRYPYIMYLRPVMDVIDLCSASAALLCSSRG
jgi:hypothetical protein